MSGNLGRMPSAQAMTKEAFLSWAREFPDSLQLRIRLYGKPRVCVPVEAPNAERGRSVTTPERNPYTVEVFVTDEGPRGIPNVWDAYVDEARGLIIMAPDGKCLAAYAPGAWRYFEVKAVA